MPRSEYLLTRLAEIAAEAPPTVPKRVVTLARFIPKEPKAHDLKFGQSIYVMPAGPIVKIGISNRPLKAVLQAQEFPEEQPEPAAESAFLAQALKLLG